MKRVICLIHLRPFRPQIYVDSPGFPSIIRNMSNARRHVLRTYGGEKDAKPLIEWLNRRPQIPQHGRIERLLANLAKVRQYYGEGERKHRLAADPRLRGISWQIEAFPSSWYGPTFRAALREAQAELACHKVWPKLEAVSNPRGRASGSTLSFGWNHSRDKAAEAVLHIMTLGQDGNLWRVRPCRRCAKWFYARFSHQEFCSTRCQEAEYKASPSWRDKRQKYMRDYRRLKASGVVK